ncbi:MAG: PQQ-binding-like beta-propeller repeat protein [Verrucomicrobiales bacterium]|nr:PQQ-binding-like beta-propeller repeat protein [Verrucomicrobiales bacterium]
MNPTTFFAIRTRPACRAVAVASLILAFGLHAAYGLDPSAAARLDFPAVDAPVRTLLATNGVVYLGGSFREIGYNSGSTLILDAPSGTLDFTWPRINGRVDVIVPDGSRGWYLGGTFTSIGGTARSGLAHLRADKSVNPDWTANLAGGTVSVITVVGRDLYVGGTFTSLKSVVRNRIAVLAASNGAVGTWNPNSSGPINAIVVAGTRVLVGGSFTNIGGLIRSNLASIESVSGQATGWDPAPNGPVSSLALAQTTLYVGGEFTSLGGLARTNLGAVNYFSGTVLPAAPNPEGPVRALWLTDDRLFFAGDFNRVGDIEGSSVAALSLASGDLSTWRGTINGPVNTLVADESYLYVGGDFPASHGGRHFEMLNLAAGSSALATGLFPGGEIRAVGVSSNTVFLGGAFALYDPATRNGFAAVRLEDGKVLPLEAGLGASTTNTRPVVSTMTLVDDTLYLGGEFVSAAGQPQTNIVALSLTNAAVLDWSVDINAAVEALHAADGNLYVAGRLMTRLAGETRSRLGAISLETGQATSWVPNPNDLITGFATGDNGWLYVSGGFSTIAGQTRGKLAAFDLKTGQLQPWDPFASGPASTVVHAIAVHSNMVFVGGSFISVGGQTRTNLAVVSADIGNALDWIADTDQRVRSIQVVGDEVFVAGDFTRVKGLSRGRAASLVRTNGAVRTWAPNISGSVMALAVEGDHAVAGGDFITVSGPNHPGIGAFHPTGYAHLATERLATGSVRIRGFGNNGEDYRLQVSSNLVDWSTLRTNRAVNGVFTYTEAGNVLTEQRYFRTAR